MINVMHVHFINDEIDMLNIIKKNGDVNKMDYIYLKAKIELCPK